jgi:glycolate oxidase FAD binding subunit
VLGTRVALSDGTLARSGGKVIKNVAGYDLAKLVTGAFGTLGLLCEVAVRLHPRPKGTASLVARVSDRAALARTAAALSHARIETDALDVRWSAGEGAVLARFGGAAAGHLAGTAKVVAAGVGATPRCRGRRAALGGAAGGPARGHHRSCGCGRLLHEE